MSLRLSDLLYVTACDRENVYKVMNSFFVEKWCIMKGWWCMRRDRSYTLCHVIRCSKWPLLEDDLTMHAWNRWPLAALERWPLKRYSNISWAGLKVTVRQRWPVRHVRLYRTIQILIVPHWYFILDTGLILRSIELFIYIQTKCMCKR
jgi:hypothetical protein